MTEDAYSKSLARAAKKIMDAVKASSFVERDPFHRFCKHLGGTPVGTTCKLPDGIEVKWKARPVPSRHGIDFEPYIKVVYTKEYPDNLGDPIADIVEDRTDGICTVAINEEYGEYMGGSALICEKTIPVDKDYLTNTREAIKEIRRKATIAQDTIDEALRVLRDHFKVEQIKEKIYKV